MRFKSTFLLAVLFIVIGGYVYFYEIRKEAERQEAGETANRVFVFDMDEVSRIYLKNYSDTMVLRRDETGWVFETPMETRGDESQINIILSSIESAEIERTVEDSAVDLEPFGLDDPQAAVQIETDQTVFDTLFLGHHNPTQSFVYSRFSGKDRVILVPATIYNNVNKKFFALRDKTVLAFEREDVNQMLLSREKEALGFQRREGKWWIKTPIEVRGDHGKIERIINNISNLRAKEIPSEGGEDLARFGLDEPWGRVDLYLGENLGMKSLLLGKARSNGDVYVRDTSRDLVFVIPPAVVKQINEDLEGYRDKKVLEFERNSVVEIGLIYPDETIRCEKDSAGDWFYYTEESPIRHPAKTSRLNRLLGDLASMRIEDYVSEIGGTLEPYGLHQPSAMIEIGLGELGSTSLSVGKTRVEVVDGEEKEYNYVMNDKDGWIFMVKGSAADKVFIDLEEIREEMTTEESE
jgi:hypothetical protein